MYFYYNLRNQALKNLIVNELNLILVCFIKNNSKSYFNLSTVADVLFFYKKLNYKKVVIKRMQYCKNNLRK